MIVLELKLNIYIMNTYQLLLKLLFNIPRMKKVLYKSHALPLSSVWYN